jgi:hypothetical protein
MLSEMCGSLPVLKVLGKRRGLAKVVIEVLG